MWNVRFRVPHLKASFVAFDNFRKPQTVCYCPSPVVCYLLLSSVVAFTVIRIIIVLFSKISSSSSVAAAVLSVIMVVLVVSSNSNRVLHSNDGGAMTVNSSGSGDYNLLCLGTAVRRVRHFVYFILSKHF